MSRNSVMRPDSSNWIQAETATPRLEMVAMASRKERGVGNM